MTTEQSEGACTPSFSSAELERILPCPFCGSDGEPYPDGDMEGYSIMCKGNKPLVIDGAEIRCPLYAFGYRSHEESVRAWNTRSNAKVS